MMGGPEEKESASTENFGPNVIFPYLKWIISRKSFLDFFCPHTVDTAWFK